MKVTTSELAIGRSTVFSNTESHKAWHILTLLLKIGPPVPLLELASRCTLFRASPGFIRSLCLIHNSPLSLIDELMVTFSPIAFAALGEFLLCSTTVSKFVSLMRGIGMFRQERIWEDVVRTYYRKLKRSSGFEYLPVAKRRSFVQDVDDEEENQNGLMFLEKMQSDYTKVIFCGDTHICRSIDLEIYDAAALSPEFEKQDTTPMVINSDVEVLSYRLKNVEQGNENKVDKYTSTKDFRHAYIPESHPNFPACEMFHDIPFPATLKTIMANMSHTEPAFLSGRGAEMDGVNSSSMIMLNEASYLKADKSMVFQQAEPENIIHDCQDSFEDEVISGRRDSKLLFGSGCHKDDKYFPVDTIEMYAVPKDESEGKIMARNKRKVSYLVKEQRDGLLGNGSSISASVHTAGQTQPIPTFHKLKIIEKDVVNPRYQAVSKTLDYSRVGGALIEGQQYKTDKKSAFLKQKLQYNCDKHIHKKENGEFSKEKDKTASIFLSESKILPNFESFIIEEEEGSGGYGTVYKARRKIDAATFAIKCPHQNAKSLHVYNELKMLERFGGKNYIIKFEGSFKNENSDCLVLEYVEHDRPEVLKKEINVFQLQWYGFCLFRALAGLHKQGIVHRDVKPGNFLFSRKVNKGYLIDFNLAMDLHQKYGTTCKSKVGYDVSFNHAPLQNSKFLPPTKNKKYSITKALEAGNQGSEKSSKSILLPTTLKRKTEQTKAFADMGKGIVRSQGADGSGITSAKEATSTRTPSAERLREPIPSHGRKELLSIVQEQLRGSSQQATSITVSKRKRIVAPSEKVDRKVVYLTPMPLQSTGRAVAGAGSLTNKGDEKHKREGPCVGTKGFRAPEVLFRSPHQGTKVDIWSAGVTLLYLMIGRTPFVGDPDLNIKEIAKFRGSEVLWELAKLHNRESSFPVQLLDVKSLASLKLRDWCKHNTRRHDFFEHIPRSLFDLVDKCLTVNPRLRISAEDALRHEFFAPCHETIQKQRLHNQWVSLESASTHPLYEQSETCSIAQ